MEQLTNLHNVTREAKLQVRILREKDIHGSGHNIHQSHTGGH